MYKKPLGCYPIQTTNNWNINITDSADFNLKKNI